MFGDFPGASYDAWKTTPPDWHMPYWLEPDEDELARMYRDYELTPFFDGDESRYEWLCQERERLQCIDAHERPADEEDIEPIEIDKITDADIRLHVDCPFCGIAWPGPLPCGHCGEPDIPTFDEDPR